jgi:hypothetical protein
MGISQVQSPFRSSQPVPLNESSTLLTLVPNLGDICINVLTQAQGDQWLVYGEYCGYECYRIRKP